jgi:hypothetical protein
MNPPANDLLLIAGKGLILLIQGVTALAGGLIALLAIAVPFFENVANAEVRAMTGPDFIAMPVGAVVGFLLILGVACALAFLFFGKLREMIDTVAAGDPFTPQNSDRLSAMAWLQIGLYSMHFIIPELEALITDWRQQFSEGPFNDGFDLNVTQIVLIFVLFILARVFRHGAAMREDLEGTV